MLVVSAAAEFFDDNSLNTYIPIPDVFSSSKQYFCKKDVFIRFVDYSIVYEPVHDWKFAWP